MDNEINIRKTPKDSSAAVNEQKPYSAQELAEMMNTHPDELFSVDIGICTDWYTNEDFIEEMLSYVKDENSIDQLIQYILLRQKYHIFVEKHPKVCYKVQDHRKYVAYVPDLSERLSAIRTRELQKREIVRSLANMRMTWSSETTVEDTPTTYKTDTLSPEFSESSSSSEEAEEAEYHLSDFDRHKLSILLIYDDITFSLFVNTMRKIVWPFVEANKKKYLNALRFVCIVHGIIAKQSTMGNFDELLQAIIPGIGSQLSSLKQRQDANNKKNLEYYVNPKLCKMDSCYQLTRDCPCLEELLQPVIDLIEG